MSTVVEDKKKTSLFNVYDEVWKVREALVADHNYWHWFERWWIEDFSWQGLKRKKKYDADIEGLQQHWIAEEDKLIEFGEETTNGVTVKKNWTRFHLPLHDLHGKLSPKHPDFTAIGKWHYKTHEKLFNDLKKSMVPPIGDVFGDKRGICYFTGTILPPKKYEVFSDDPFADKIDIEWCYFPPETTISGFTFSMSTSFANSYFGRKTKFHNCQFGDSIDFRNCIFGAAISFEGVIFGDNCIFDASVFNGSIDFSSAEFGESISFKNIEFQDESTFHGVFKGLAFFDESTFTYKARFSDSEFTNRVSYKKCTFLGGAEFIDVDTSSRFSFENAIFDGDFVFSEKNDEKFLGDFDNAKFGALTDFSGSSLHSDSSFSNCIFSEPIKENASHSEKAYRSLYRELEQINDRSSAFEIGRLILQAKLLQYPCKDVSFGSFMVLFLYKWFSNFGQSLIRPLIGLISTVILWSVFYNWVLISPSNLCVITQSGCDVIVKGNLLSLSLSVPPLSQLVAGYMSQGSSIAWIDGGEIILGALAVSQLSICIIFIFLFGLAVRRRVLLN